jgi:excinuclease UvrABC nuclease subunit
MPDDLMPDADDLNPLHLPSVSMAELAALPDVSAVYFVMDMHDPLLLYIGRACRLRTRWQSHHRRKLYRHIAKARLAWFAIEPRYVRWLEKVCIDLFKPRDNGCALLDTYWMNFLRQLPSCGVRAVRSRCHAQ